MDHELGLARPEPCLIKSPARLCARCVGRRERLPVPRHTHEPFDRPARPLSAVVYSAFAPGGFLRDKEFTSNLPNEKKEGQAKGTDKTGYPTSGKVSGAAKSGRYRLWVVATFRLHPARRVRKLPTEQDRTVDYRPES